MRRPGRGRAPGLSRAERAQGGRRFADQASEARAGLIAALPGADLRGDPIAHETVGAGRRPLAPWPDGKGTVRGPVGWGIAQAIIDGRPAGARRWFLDGGSPCFNGASTTTAAARRARAAGTRFQHVDTEVILHAYGSGERGRDRLNACSLSAVGGAYHAQSLSRARTVRDKPLYYWTDGRHFAFGRDEALHDLPGLKRNLAARGPLVLPFRTLPDGFLRGVKLCHPAQWTVGAEVARGRRSIWDYTVRHRPPVTITRRLRRAHLGHFQEAAVRQIVSDVPSEAIDGRHGFGSLTAIAWRPWQEKSSRRIRTTSGRAQPLRTNAFREMMAQPQDEHYEVVPPRRAHRSRWGQLIFNSRTWRGPVLPKL